MNRTKKDTPLLDKYSEKAINFYGSKASSFKVPFDEGLQRTIERYRRANWKYASILKKVKTNL